MKRFIFMAALCCVIGLTLTGCKKDTEIGTRAQLIGRWVGQSTITSGLVHFVFLDEAASEGYAWGYTWDEGDDESEEYIISETYHKHGWYQWKKENTYLRMIHMTNLGDATSAIDQELYELTDSKLSFNDAGTRVNLTKE